MQPRRALVEPTDKRSWGGKKMAAAAVAGVMVVSAGAYAATKQMRGDSPAQCQDQITIAVDPAWLPAARAAGEAWHRSGCAAPQLVEKSSREVAEQGLQEDAWIPEDPVWTSRAAHGGDQLTASVVGWSPIVVANRAEVFDALKGPMDARTLQMLSPIRGNWGTFGRPEWGQVKLVVPPAEESVVGAVGFSDLLAQVGQGEAPNGNPFGGTAVQQSMAVMQHRIVERPSVDKVTQVLESHRADAAIAQAAGPRTGITTEHLVLANPDGIGGTPLGKGSAIQMAVLAPGGEETVPAQFAQWLKEQAGSKALAEAGVRTASAQIPGDKLNRVWLDAAAPAPVPVSADRFEAAQTLSRQYARRYSVLLALDLSGSMAQPMGGAGGQTRMEVLSKMVLQLWGVWPPSMSTGVMTFRADDDLKPVIEYPVPLDVVSSPTFQKNSTQTKKLFANPPIGGGTPLYDAIAQAWRTAHEDYQQEADNRIVVVTDGKASDAQEKHTLDSLVKELNASADPQRPVRVLYVGLGPDADMPSLQKIAQDTGQQALGVSTQDELAAVIARFITN
ncbi:vWA domain-containing protein [Luteococcus sp. Sow4_B9]|uniref:vWA domain-containing protein n=1 Tax=Luteococcus sp. Sow4_B9 TaxID=3438792 RepID=UPI003F970F3C